MLSKLQTKNCLLFFYLPLFFFGVVQVKASFMPLTLREIYMQRMAPDTTVKTIHIADHKDKKVDLTSTIEYSARDSVVEDVTNKIVWLYGDASLKYETTEITQASIIKVDFANNTLSAFETLDSLGNRVGVPQIAQGAERFKAKDLSFNFNTKKVLVHNVIYKEGEGFLHGNIVKKVNDSVTNVGSGLYTTCDLDHPHFALKFKKAKVLSGNKIVTGPVILTIEDVPLPLVLPFGIFPNKRGRSSGLLMPRWGEARNRGFYLEDGGYYWGISDYVDLKLTGDIYTRGSWAVKPLLSYYKRYKFQGSFNFNYAINVLGVKGTVDYSKSRDFFVSWSHRQDPKARPNSVFSANVNAGSSKFNKFTPGSFNDYVSNTFSSSISYDRRLGDFGNITTSLRHSQNTSTHRVDLSLPEVAFNINRIYPFKRKIQVGEQKWFEKISLSYNMNMRNEVSTYDSLLFKKDIFNKMRTGMQHVIPLSISLNILKYFNWSNSINYNERWYLKTIRKKWTNDTLYQNGQMQIGYVKIDTVSGFKASRDYSFSSSVGTTLYGTKLFKKGFLMGIRHVMRPSVGFSFTPDFGTEKLGYYRTVQTDKKGNTQKYSIFEGGLFGMPPMQKSGSLNFSVGNNIEAKLRTKRDTTGQGEKISLIDNLSLSASYDLARDSMRWSPVSVSAYTTLFKKIQVSYSATLNLYHADTLGRTVNKFEYMVSKKPFNLTNSNWSVSFSYDLNPPKSNKNTPHPVNNMRRLNEYESPYELNDIHNNAMYVDWDNTWSLRFSYNLGYSSNRIYNSQKHAFEYKRDLTQTANISGDINVTEKWKLSGQAGFDVQTKKVSFAQFTIYRDLHCWEMRFSWIPFGFQQSWNFQINVKAPTLKDLKLEKRKDFRDNY